MATQKVMAAALLPLVGAASFFAAPCRGEDRLPSLVVTQLPLGTRAEAVVQTAQGMQRADYGEGARIVLLLGEGRYRVLSQGFHSAADPSPSFDGKRIVFAGKRQAADPWAIWEMAVDGTAASLRKISEGPGHCRSPFYMATVHTLTPTSTEPWEQVGFIGSDLEELNDLGDDPAGSLYSCKLDGTALRRLTHNISSDMDPVLMQDGRVVLASWQRSRLRHGALGRVSLFGINLDGTDYSILVGDEGLRIKHMPCVTTRRLIVFVEADQVGWDGAGPLASVSLRRTLHSRRSLTEPAAGLFHSPSPLPDGSILVSRRPAVGGGSHGVYRLDPDADSLSPTLIFDDPEHHDIQAKALVSRPLPDGRSSVVNESDPEGIFYGLDAYTSDLAPEWLKPGMLERLRVLEGLPRRRGDEGTGIPALVQRRLLGEAPIHGDGSFHIKVPANTPLELQVLDADGLALRTCGWIWARAHEPRGCIGCHEDPELAPRNRFVSALKEPPVKLTLPPENRRTVDFRRDVMPIIEARCSSCHGEGGTVPSLAPGPAGEEPFNRTYEALLSPSPAEGGERYVVPGQARTSPLIWHLFGRNTSRPWDGDAASRPVKLMPQTQSGLTELERRIFVEWIDLGASWSGIPATTRASEGGGER